MRKLGPSSALAPLAAPLEADSALARPVRGRWAEDLPRTVRGEERQWAARRRSGEPASSRPTPRTVERPMSSTPFPSFRDGPTGMGLRRDDRRARGAAGGQGGPAGRVHSSCSPRCARWRCSRRPKRRVSSVRGDRRRTARPGDPRARALRSTPARWRPGLLRPLSREESSRVAAAGAGWSHPVAAMDRRPGTRGGGARRPLQRGNPRRGANEGLVGTERPLALELRPEHERLLGHQALDGEAVQKAADDPAVPESLFSLERRERHHPGARSRSALRRSSADRRLRRSRRHRG